MKNFSIFTIFLEIFRIFLKKQLAKNIFYDILSITTLRGGAVVARQAHNLKAVGSIPAPATNEIQGLVNASPFLLLIFNKLRLHLTRLDNSGIYWLRLMI